MRQSHLILSNAAIMWVARVLLLVPQLILIPLLIATIGNTGYGIYALVWSLMAAIDQLQNSLQSGVVKYSAAYLASNQTNQVNAVVSSSFVYSLLLGIVGCTVILAGAAFSTEWMPEIAPLLVVVGAAVLLVIPLTPYVAVIQSRQHYYVGAIADTVARYIGLAAVALCFYGFEIHSVMAPIIIMAGMLFISRLAQVPLAYYLIPGLRNRPTAFDWRTFQLIASFGGLTVLLALCAAANNAGVRWLMGVLESPDVVAHLAIIVMPGLLLSQLIQPLTITIMPATSAYEASGRFDSLRELLLRTMRYSAVLVIAGFVAAALLMANVLTLWVGTEYEFLAPYALTVLGSTAFLMVASAAHHMLKGIGRLRAVVLSSFLGSVLIPIAAILLITSEWRDPYLAVAIGLSSGNLLRGGLEIFFAMRAVQASPRFLLTRVLGQPLALGLVILGPCIGIMWYVQMDSVGGRVMASLVAVGIFCLGVYCVLFTEAERRDSGDILHLAASQIPFFRKFLAGARQPKS